jgi:hypothetical protein
MSTSLLTRAFNVLMAEFMFSTKKANKIQEKSAEEKTEKLEAKRIFTKAQIKFDNEYRVFQNESKQRLELQEKNIAEFKEKIESEPIYNKKNYQNILAEFEQKIIIMKRMLDDFKIEGKVTWPFFKSEFNYEMDEFTGEIITFSKAHKIQLKPNLSVN